MSNYNFREDMTLYRPFKGKRHKKKSNQRSSGTRMLGEHIENNRIPEEEKIRREMKESQRRRDNIGTRPNSSLVW